MNGYKENRLSGIIAEHSMKVEFVTYFQYE